jgi:pilus assembly protein CpaC
MLLAGQCHAQISLPGYQQSVSPVSSLAVPMGAIQGSEVSGQIDAVHSPNVEKLLTPQYRLELDRRHSQLIITSRNVRRIAVTDSTIANYVQYSPTELAVVGLEVGKTDLMVWFQDENTPSIYEVTVSRDESLERQRQTDFGRLERRLAMIFPNSNVYLEPVGTQVIVKGQAYDSEEANHIMQIVRAEVIRTIGLYDDDYGQGGANRGGQNGYNAYDQNQFQDNNRRVNDIVVNMLQIPGDFNVKMRVVIAEVSRSELRDAGVDWNVLFNNGRHSIGGSLGGATATTLSGIFENGEINLLVRWLASNGTATLLAEPTIVCMSGHSASLLAGGEFPVPTIIGLGGGQNTAFRGVGTSMVVTPTVMDRDLIRLQIVPEFSAVNNDNAVNGIPGTNVKRVQTTVELREGQTLAIGGLISRQGTTDVSRIPLLGDIPFIGSRLFHGKHSSEGETELLVLVSPEIVRPMEPDEVPPLPNYYITHPNDHDLFKYGRTEGNPDTNVYQVQPYGSGATFGVPQGYSLFNPPVNGPGFTPPQTMTAPNVQYHSQQTVPQMQPMPQPSQPAPAPAPPVQPMQTYPQNAPQQVQPAAPVPQSPLPPVPGAYQGASFQSTGFQGASLQGAGFQGASSQPQAETNKTVVSRMTGLFRRKDSSTTKPNTIKPVSWQK